MNIFLGVIIIFWGVFTILEVFLNWNNFSNSSKAKPFFKVFGKTGTRVIFFILALFLIVLEILLLI